MPIWRSTSDDTRAKHVLSGAWAMLRLAAIFLGLAPASHAATPLIISPITVEIPAGRRSAVLTVQNEGDDSVDLQVRAFRWDQSGGQDTLSPTDLLIVSPPIVTVAPHARQIFRILLANAAPRTGESSFRLKLLELPRPAANGVTINLEFSIPVFDEPPGAAPALIGQLVSGRLTLTNQGGRRIKLLSASAIAADGSSVAVPALGSAYILAGATRAFALPHPNIVRLTGASDAGPIDVSLAPTPVR